MNDFKTTYRDAMSGVETVHIDIASVLDEGRRKRLRAHRNRQKFMTVAAVGLVFCLCTLGSVQAADYIKTVIKVNEYGFQSADMVTMARTEGKEEAAEDTVMSGGISKEEEEAFAELEKMEPDELVIEAMEDTLKEYASVEEFREKESAVMVLPDMEKLGYQVDSEKIWVSGTFISVLFSCGERQIFFDRVDYSNAKKGHASSTVYTGGVCDERSFTTKQGYEYILVDSVKEEKDETPEIHAAISVGYYELYADFTGYEEGEVMQILESMDLSAYEPDFSK